MGDLRVLDLQPADLPEGLSDSCKGLLLPLHAPVILDSITETLQFRFLEGDSVKSVLNRRPGDASHVIREGVVVLTGPTREVPGFLAAMVRRPGVLTDSAIWRRQQP